jgi:hypothetical protein
MAAILHVKCPICGKILDAVVKVETWGTIPASDIAIGEVTISDMDVNAHIMAHGVTARLEALRSEYAMRSQINYPVVIARLDEQIARATEREGVLA